MNLRGSYTALRNNSKAAMLAAIEIYNKPQIPYRNECFSILLVNAWELFFKAILSKNKQRIFYPKKRNEPYRTLSVQDALKRGKSFFPPDIPYDPIAENINMLVNYRNNTLHFYNQRELEVIIYGLAQTSIINYRDLMLSIFNADIANEMAINLLPLSFGAQPDPIQFLQSTREDPPKSKALAQFLRELSEATKLLESKSFDTSRFLTVFRVNLQSVKKISSSDIVVGIDGAADDSETLVVERRVDPNVSHPKRRHDILDEIGSNLNGVKFTSYTFEAIAWKHNLKGRPHLCWRSDIGGVTQYSAELTSYLRKLSKKEIESAVNEYKEYLKKRRSRRKKKK